MKTNNSNDNKKCVVIETLILNLKKVRVEL
jgi:hypothetical protein